MMKFDVRVGGQLQIGDGIILTVERKSGQLARISVDAPPALKVRLLNREPDQPNTVS
ncbi:carbon storage regulator [Sphingobium sufflavum]|uniref:carbon storage regulator n=1 Tax=Sphingobium sufflavum TaxID=1129547 RepID=UPI001F19332D|nr:carbon storage regulator [Sphingobium sufflavum]MCE7797862.1 carbon storage regulator [Sphingobium sufflavum]